LPEFVVKRYSSFLIRLWREASSVESEPEAEWRVEVEHIQSGQSWTLDTLDEMLACIRCLAEHPPELCRPAAE
jgi:hypothetical protein